MLRRGWGAPACQDRELGCFWVFMLAGMLTWIQILDINRWMAGKKGHLLHPSARIFSLTLCPACCVAAGEC